MRRCLILAAVIIAMPAGIAAQAAPVTLTRAEFNDLRWLEGTWRGSGPGYPSFYETYEFLDDSTMRRHAYVDSTLANPAETTLFEWRGGHLHQVRGGQNRSALVAFAADSLRWANLNGNGGTLYVRRSSDHWSAILSRTDRPDVTYELRRHRP